MEQVQWQVNCEVAKVWFAITWDSKSITEAYGLLQDIQSSEFLVAFHVCRFFFAFTKDIAQLLQGSSVDVLTAYVQVN